MSESNHRSRQKLFAGLCIASLAICAAGYFGSRWNSGADLIERIADLFTGPRPLAADDQTARIVRLLGKARIKNGEADDWRPAKIGQSVTNGDLIETGPQSRLIIHYRGTQIRLAARTRTRVDNLLDNSRESHVHLQKGFAWFSVNGKQQPRGFSVSTPTAIASVRGTKFSLAETGQGALSCVCEGTVDMRNLVNAAARSDAVNAGASYTYNSDGSRLAKDFAGYFRGLKSDRSFQSQILKDNRLNYCKTCHRMTNLATDDSEDPKEY